MSRLPDLSTICRSNIVSLLATCLAIALLSAGCSRRPAADRSSGGKLGVGDPAPPLELASIIKGDPLPSTLDGSVHVVEFWATWCGPCRAGMPHISKLQDEYGDKVTFIGVTDETAAEVDAFLASESMVGRPWSDVISYRLALDSNGATNAAYMKAAGENGIPTAFIVGREGTIEWIGHPGEIDNPLQKIVDGTWNAQAAADDHLRQQRMAAGHLKLSQLVADQNWNGAISELDQLEQELGVSPMLLYSRLSILESSGQQEQANETRNRLVETSWDNAMLLNSVAWDIAVAEGDRDLDLAVKAAARASQLTSDADAAVLDTLARVHYERGDLDKAIAWQRKAVEHNEGRKQIDAALEKYLAEQSVALDSRADDSPADDSPVGEPRRESGPELASASRPE